MRGKETIALGEDEAVKREETKRGKNNEREIKKKEMQSRGEKWEKEQKF